VIGSTVSHYRIVDTLGRGGMGVVYKAEDVRLGRLVALKFLSPQFAHEGQAFERLRREARVVAALEHENICPVYDIGEHEGGCFIVMQLLDGMTLADRLSGGHLDIEEATTFGIEIASALDKAHRGGIVHRDLKPGNVFITRDGHVKLLDFGLAKVNLDHAAQSVMPTVAAAPLTNPGVAVGTVAYMSPEQARGEELDARSDLFSFGAVLYEMVTGRPAFKGSTSAVIFDAILNRTPESPASINPQVPPTLGDIIYKALERDRETRYQSAADIRADLKRLRRDSTSGYALPPAAAPQHRAPTRMWVTAVGVVAALAIALVLLFRQFGGEPASSNPWAEHRLRLFLSSAETVAQASLASDAGTIVYTSIENGQRDLFLSRAAGGARVRVTNDAATEFDPQLSPDGETIVFARLVPGREGELEICTTPAFGGTVTPIIPGGRHPVWSPDGRRIAFVRQTAGAAPTVAVADANGGNVRVLLETDATYIRFGTVTWSPDGSQLAVERSMGGVTGEIWMVPVAGGQARRLWQDPPEVFSHSPVFTADGSGIVHSSNRGGATNLWLMFTNGRAPAQLTTGPGPDEYPTVSRTGTLAFSNTRVRHVLLLHDDVSGAPRELLSHSWFLWAPVFSPTRREIAVSRSEPDGSWRIWMVPLDGAPPRRLTSGTTPEIYPRFTPNGDAVTYSAWSPQADRVWTVPRTGGPGTPITPARDDDDAYADVSPDGRWVAFARSEAGVARVHVAPFDSKERHEGVLVDGGPARRLTDGPSTTPRWSPDSRWIAYSPTRTAGGGIFVIAADGTGGRQLSRTGGWPVWWPDQSRIAFWTVGPTGDQEIQVVPLKGGTASTLRGITFTGTNHPFDVSATGQIVRTDAVHLNTEVWLMEPSAP
jgi:serine/threonine protein kinase/Tol biopolymer transport system component